MAKKKIVYREGGEGCSCRGDGDTGRLPAKKKPVRRRAKKESGIVQYDREGLGMPGELLLISSIDKSAVLIKRE